MSKFKVGDFVWAIPHQGQDGLVTPGGKYKVLAVHPLDENLIQIDSVKAGEYWFLADRFDLWQVRMEDVKRGRGLQAEFYQRVSSIKDRLARDASYDEVQQVETAEEPQIRQFTTGATRNLDKSKLDYEGFLSPLALKAFAEYMHSHRQQKDDTFRDSDNWQKGIPHDVYVKSLFRHFFDLWSLHRGGAPISPDSGLQVDQVEALCAMMFNVQGLLHELLKERSNG
jgi:hypothetical protein